jgi:nicotinamide-nucleotide amidase
LAERETPFSVAAREAKEGSVTIEFTKIDEAIICRAAEVLALAKRKGLTLVTAESCTGGLLASVLSDAPGAAERLQGGFTVYTKEHKTVALGIPRALLERESAVSEPVARALAEEALAHSIADIAVSITGVAGPSTDGDGNPVGLVHFAAARRRFTTIHLRREFGDIGRGAVRYQAVMQALVLIERAAMLDEDSRHAAE